MDEQSKKSKFLANQYIPGLIFGLLVIGLFVTFAPKVVPHTSPEISVAKETAGLIDTAYSNYQIEHTVSTNTSAKDLISYLPYQKVDTGSRYMAKAGEALQPCSDALPCLLLTNGGVLQYDKNQLFGGTTSAHAIFFNLDPDGQGPAGRMSFYLYATRRITSGQTKLPQTVSDRKSVLTSQDEDPNYLYSGRR